MALFVLLTISLRQKGSSESKKIGEKEEVDREPYPSKQDAPWPVHKGGLIYLYTSIHYPLPCCYCFCYLSSFIFTAALKITKKSKHMQASN